MIRALSLAAALAAGLAFPAFADDTSANTAAEAQATQGPATQNLFTQDQARQHLMHLGYTNISGLTKDADGKWVGTATKDGRTLIVAVDVKGSPVVAK
jgi:hypothetical protein